MAKATLFIATLTLLTTSIFAAPKRKSSPNSPAFVRFSLTGGTLLKEADYVKYDPKSHYYLIATGACDGSSIDLILTPSPSASGQGENDQEWAKGQNIRRVTLPHLRDGQGVNIGDTPQQVQEKLRASPHQVFARNELKAREWVYYANILIKSRQMRGMQNYRATYTFRQGRLWSIAYNVQEEDGCD